MKQLPLKRILIISFLIALTYYSLSWILFSNAVTDELILIYPAVMAWGAGFQSGEKAMYLTAVYYLSVIWLITFIALLLFFIIKGKIIQKKNRD